MDSEKLGKKIGFIVMLFLSSAIFFWILKFVGRLPYKWNYFNILAIVSMALLTGLIIKKALK